MFLPLLVLFLPFTLISSFTGDSHTLIPRGRVSSGSGGSGYPFGPDARIDQIKNLPGGFELASPDLPEFQSSFVIRADDPNANGFAGRWVGGGTRHDIYGNQ